MSLQKISKRKKFIIPSLTLLPLLLASCGKTYEVIPVKYDAHDTYMENDGGTFDGIYSDGYFVMDNSQYHEELASISFSLQFAGSPDLKHGANLKNFFKDIGFKDTYFVPYFFEPTKPDGMASAFAHKEIDGKEVVAVYLRGSEYGKEFSNNVTIGKEGEAVGFAKSADIVMKDLASYLKSVNISSNYKVWLTGHSRGAAVGNLLAARLVDGEGELKVDKSDIYAYCVSTPSAGTIEKKNNAGDNYRGIYNLINYDDPIPLLPPPEWNFTTYGTNLYFPNRINDYQYALNGSAAFQNRLVEMLGNSDKVAYNPDGWYVKDTAYSNPDIGVALRRLISALATDGMKSREEYADKYQNLISELLATILDSEVVSELEGIVSSLALLFLINGELDVLMEYLDENDYDGFADEVVNFLNKNLPSGFKTKISFDSLKEKVKDLVSMLAKFYDENLYLFDKFSLMELLGIYKPHLKQNCLVLFSMTDSRLVKEGETAYSLNDGSFLKLHLPKAKKLSIKGPSDKALAEVKEGKVSSSFLSIELTDEGIDVILPKRTAYTFTTDISNATLYNVTPELKEQSLKVFNATEGSIDPIN